MKKYFNIKFIALAYILGFTASFIYSSIKKHSLESNSSQFKVKFKVHVVKQDETLGEISQKYYGTWLKWKLIKRANKKGTTNDILQPGQKLIIPILMSHAKK